MMGKGTSSFQKNTNTMTQYMNFQNIQNKHTLIMDTYICSKKMLEMHAYVACRKASNGMIRSFLRILVMSCVEG